MVNMDYFMDCFKEKKEELVLLYLRSYFQAMNIFNLITAYPRLVNDINLAETFDKLLDIHSLNNKSLIETFYLFKQLDDKNGFFLLGNIIDIKNTLKEDMDLEDILYISMSDYILINENIIIDPEEVEEKLENYADSDDNCLRVVEANDKLLRKIMLDTERGM